MTSTMPNTLRRRTALALVATCLVHAGCSDDQNQEQPDPEAAQGVTEAAQGVTQDANSDISYFDGVFTTNEKWDDDDERAMNFDDDDWIHYLKWEGPGPPDFPDYTDPAAPEYLAKSNEVGARHPKLQTYHQNFHDYQRKRSLCQAEFDSGVTDRDDNRLCYPKVVVHVGDDIDPVEEGCANINFSEMRYGRYCGWHFPVGHPFNDNTREPIDGVDYCCRLHDWGIWSWEWEKDHTLDVEDLKACGMMMCLSQASGYPSNITTLMPDVEESRICWYEWAGIACEGTQPTLPPLGLPSD